MRGLWIRWKNVKKMWIESVVPVLDCGKSLASLRNDRIIILFWSDIIIL